MPIGNRDKTENGCKSEMICGCFCVSGTKVFPIKQYKNLEELCDKKYNFIKVLRRKAEYGGNAETAWQCK
jgi:hypothetical protein